MIFMGYNYPTLEQLEKKKKIAKAKSRNAPISFKFSVELAREIKGRKYSSVLKFIERIIKKEEHLPIRKFRKKVAHRKGEAKSKVKSGRYPIRVARVWKKLLESAEKNADALGLDIKNLYVLHAFTSKGLRRITIQKKGRMRYRRKKACHIEIILEERTEEKKEKKEAKLKTREDKKTKERKEKTERKIKKESGEKND